MHNEKLRDGLEHISAIFDVADTGGMSIFMNFINSHYINVVLYLCVNFLETKHTFTVIIRLPQSISSTTETVIFSLAGVSGIYHFSTLPV